MPGQTLEKDADEQVPHRLFADQGDEKHKSGRTDVRRRQDMKTFVMGWA